MTVCSICCCSLVLGAVFLIGSASAGTGLHAKGPRNCGDVLLRGDLIEGYYAVYPNASDPNEAGLIYCGVKDGMSPRNSSAPWSDPKNCRDLLDAGMTQSGINVIYPYASSPDIPVIVYCEQELMQGGWTVFQHRRKMDTQLDFYRTFTDYAVGFGNIGSEFWLGNDIIHELTSQNTNELYVNLTDVNGVNKYAHYSSFYVGQKEPIYAHTYRLSVGHFTGTAGDGMASDSGIGFSTFDADHDDWNDSNGHCAEW